MASESKTKNIPDCFLKHVFWDGECPIWNGNRNNKQPHMKMNKVGINVIFELFRLLHKMESINSRTHSLEPICGKEDCIEPEHRMLISKCIPEEEYRQRTIERMMKNSTLLETGCRVWNLTKDAEGYGKMGFHGKSSQICHRVWYQLMHPEQTEEEKKLHMLHTCTNKACFIHARPGTRIENAQDRIRDGTDTIGSNHPQATITEETAKAIYALRDKGSERGYCDVVATQYNTTKKVVKSIWYEEKWCHVTNPEKVKTHQLKRRVAAEKARNKIATRQDYEKAMERLLATCTLDENGCLQSSLTKLNGYAQMSFLNVQRYAHVVAAEYYHNDCKKISKGFEVAHSCKGKCVLKEHLRITTRKDNMLDEYTVEQREFVKKVVESQGNGTIEERAKKFGVKRRVISRIDHGVTFSALTGIVKKRKLTDLSKFAFRKAEEEEKEEEEKEEEEEEEQEENEEEREGEEQEEE